MQEKLQNKRENSKGLRKNEITLREGEINM